MAKKPVVKRKLTKEELENQKMRRLIMGAAILIAVGFFPLFCVVFIGMLPTIALLITERTINRYKTKSVGFPNFIGTFYMATPMLKYEGMQTIEKALEIITNPKNLIVPYILSLLGLLLVLFLPIIVNLYLSKAQLVREKKLTDDRNKLISLWGEEVNKNAPPIITLDQLRVEEAQKKLRNAAQNSSNFAHNRN